MTGDINISIDDLPEDWQDVAQVIGLDAALKLARVYSGDQLYVPKWESVVRQHRDRQIYDDFDGCGDYGRVARKHNLSVSHIRQIIREERQRRFIHLKPVQGELFITS